MPQWVCERLQIQFRISRSFRPRNLANLGSKIRFWIRRKEHTPKELSLFIVFLENTLKLTTFSQRWIKLLVGILFEFFTPSKLTEIQRRISLLPHGIEACYPEYSLSVIKSSLLIKNWANLMSRNESNYEWKSVLATLSMSFSPNTRQVLPKLQSIIEFSVTKFEWSV